MQIYEDNLINSELENRRVEKQTIICVFFGKMLTLKRELQLMND